MPPTLTTQDPYLLTPMTLLDAVNLCLNNIGTAARTSIDGVDWNPDAADALKIVHNWLIQTQQTGWQWNREIGMTLDPDPDTGEIRLPSNTLRVDTIYRDAGLNLVERGGYLYNPNKSTYNIGKAVTVDLVVALPYEALPQPVRYYVAVKAARQFAQNKLNNGQTNQYTAEDEIKAWVSVQEAEDDSDDLTLAEKNPHLIRQQAHRRRVS